jgi:PAS domain S-box-containing protein
MSISAPGQLFPFISGPPEAVVRTSELSVRPSRPPNFEAENRALAYLIQELAAAPSIVMQKIAETALSLCAAHSAGISVLEKENGCDIFRWRAVAGRWSGYLGSTVPRETSASTLVLNGGGMLLSHPERYYPIPPHVSPPVSEVLLLPFYEEGRPVGTIWVVSHDDSRRFDKEDERVLTSLSRFASAAYQILGARDRTRDSELRFGAMLEALPAAIYTTDADGRITHFNQAAVHFSGRVPELGTDHWCVSWKLYRPDGSPLPHDQCPMALALKEGRIVRGSELIAERPDGQRIWVMPYPTPLRDSEGRIVGGVNMLVDITERKRAEEVQARLAAIVDSSDDAIVAKTLDGVITSWNRGAEMIFGYSEQEAVGRHISLIIPEERLPEEDDVLARLRRGEKIDHFETERRAKDGRVLHISLTVSPIRDSTGRVVGASKVARDITERKRAEQQLRQAQKAESIGNLAGGIAHDFNNLLTGILGNASLAIDVLSPDHPARELLDEVVRASESAADLTRQMLAYAGKGQFVLEAVNLSELVRRLHNLIQASVPRTIQLDLDLDGHLPHVEADAGQLQQLVLNLVLNGAEAIPEDKTGVVRVATRMQNVDERYLRQASCTHDIKPGPYVVLEVRDNGRGMDERTKSRIFDPFFSTKFTGRGLGLAAALGIVRAHKGAIEVSSAPGSGSVFRVLFPVLKTTPGKGASAARQAEAPTQKRTILVVDDEEIVRRTARTALHRYGYTVLLAENGQRAVELFGAASDQISLVILDLTMPVMSGEETLDRLQAIRPDVPVILTSGHDPMDAIGRFGGKRLAGFIQKPYAAADLAGKVETVLA